MRTSGILLHISSLPSPGGIGSLGQEAYEFADFLHASGMRIWQVLPIGPVGYGESPYHYLGYEDSKKYYGTYNFGIDENGIKKVVYRGANRTGIVGSAGPTESFEEFYPTKKQERNLMNAPRRWEKAIYKLREINK